MASGNIAVNRRRYEHIFYQKKQQVPYRIYLQFVHHNANTTGCLVNLFHQCVREELSLSGKTTMAEAV